MRNTRWLINLTLMAASGLACFYGSALSAQDGADQSAEPVYEIGNGVTAPKSVYAPNPSYDDKARKKKINGVVILAMVVTAEGKVRDVKVIKSLDEGLDKQAMAAVSKWRFEPATKDGKPVAVHLKTEVDFRLY
jgi:TonB family protein